MRTFRWVTEATALSDLKLGQVIVVPIRSGASRTDIARTHTMYYVVSFIKPVPTIKILYSLEIQGSSEPILSTNGVKSLNQFYDGCSYIVSVFQNYETTGILC